ncbi:MAG TPA: hypothetical protein VMZ69_10045 [Saprospiraceae bacterium]|nr:hypothetical protein [Saprospiraceae bacterium]
MIIPSHIKEHLKGPTGIFLGTRDKDLNCDLLRVLGASATGHDTIKFFIAEKSSGQTLDNLRSNKLVSLSATNVFTLESFQYKGRFLSVRPVNEEEAKAVFEFVTEFEEAITKLGYKPGIVANNVIYDPALAIEFMVEQIFDQTPKVGAGKQIASV